MRDDLDTGAPASVPLADPRSSGGWQRRDRWSYRVLASSWLVSLTVMWTWWFSGDHVVGVARLVISSTLLAWTSVTTGWFVFFVGRFTPLRRDLPMPEVRTAMVVTKAPSEPWPLVRRTIEHALAQAPPHDTWLADELPSDEVLRWCAEHGVRVSTRRGVEEYHREAWPRRTRCKEGNLAYFYDTIGYRDYDVVVQLDADHAPEPGYLEEMLRPFSAPDVGYVSAPSLCDANIERSWAVRARCHAEAGLHGVLQGGFSSGFAPLCIGSHYAVRTNALQGIGGLGPELAEDHSTTLLLNAAGWRGVHALDAEAHGDGPESFADLVRQEFQWSRSLVNLLLTVTPGTLRRLPARLKVQFLFAQLWYPTLGLVMLASVLTPLVALLTATPWMRLPYVAFAASSMLVTVYVLTMLAWVRRRGWLRPVDAPLVSWESALFLVLRWPWVLCGTAAALVDAARGKAFVFDVTPKAQADKPLPFRLLAPYVLIAGSSALVALAVPSPGEATGYYWFALVNAVLYTASLVAVLVLHVRENPSVRSTGRLRPHAAAVGLLALITLAACLDRGPAAVRALAWSGERPTREAVAIAPSDAPMIGVPEATVNLGVYDFGGRFAGSNRFAISHEFLSWVDPDPIATSAQVFAEQAIEQGRFPMLTVEPYPHGGASATLLEDIAAGAYDAETDAVCRALAAVEHPVFVRWGHEMDVVSGRYPWAVEDASSFVAAYRTFATRCRELVGDDLFMVWSPVGSSDLEAYWPGRDVVDYVGLSVFDYPEWRRSMGEPEQTFDQLFGPRYERLAGYDRPMVIAEFGSARAPAERVAWINDALASTPRYPLLKSIVFFSAPDTPGVWGDDVPTPDWRIDPEALPSD